MARKTTARPRPQLIYVSAAVPAVIHSEPEAGGYSAEVPSLPGCYTQGETIDEVEANLREAIEGWLAVAHEDGAANPNARRKRV